MDPREELLLPPVEIPGPAAPAVPRAPHVSAARCPPQRDPAPARGRPRGHLDEPGGAGLGHPVALRPIERRVRLVRRADQLRVRSGIPRRSRDVRALVARRPARGRQGHHPLPLRRVAGHAAERRLARAAPGVRPRLDSLQGAADEQVPRDGRRSPRCRQFPRPRSPAPVSREGDPLWRRRGFLVGAVRGALQRRSGEQPREPRKSVDHHDPPLSGGSRASHATGAGPACRAGRPDRHGLPGINGPVRPARGRRRRVRPSGCRQRVHRRDRAMDHRQGSSRQRSPQRRPARGARRLADCGCPAPTRNALVGLGDPPSARRHGTGGRLANRPGRVGDQRRPSDHQG